MTARALIPVLVALVAAGCERAPAKGDDTDVTDTDVTDTEVPDTDAPDTDVDETDLTDTDATPDTEVSDTDDEPAVADADADGSPDDEDCDDTDPSVRPGAPELCDDLVQDCDGTAAWLPNTASWFPADGGPGVDVATALGGVAWTAPGDGLLRLCGGSWPGAVIVGTGVALEITSHEPAERATLAGALSLAGVADVHGVDLGGTVNSTGSSSAAIELRDVSSHATPNFSGTVAITASDSTFVSAGEFTASGRGALVLTDVTIDAPDGAANPLAGAPTTLTRVHATVANQGFAMSDAVSVNDSTFISTGPGAAVRLYNLSALVFAGNTLESEGASSGAAALLDAYATAGSFTITDTELLMAGERSGLSFRGTWNLTCSGCTFREPAHGPAITTAGVSGNLILLDSTFEGTNGVPAGGEGNFVLFDGTGFSRLEVRRTTFADGYTAGNGGAINLTRGQAILDTVTFTGNRAGGHGGGLAVTNSVLTSLSLTVQNSTFADNTAGGYGGGFYSHNQTSVSTSTFTDNVGDLGAGAFLALNGTVSLNTSTVQRNDGGANAAIIYSGSGSLVVTNSDLGAGVDDNVTPDVRVASSLNGVTMGSLTHSAGVGASFTCFGTLTCN